MAATFWAKDWDQIILIFCFSLAENPLSGLAMNLFLEVNVFWTFGASLRLCKTRFTLVTCVTPPCLVLIHIWKRRDCITCCISLQPCSSGVLILPHQARMSSFESKLDPSRPTELQCSDSKSNRSAQQKSYSWSLLVDAFIYIKINMHSCNICLPFTFLCRTRQICQVATFSPAGPVTGSLQSLPRQEMRVAGHRLQFAPEGLCPESFWPTFTLQHGGCIPHTPLGPGAAGEKGRQKVPLMDVLCRDSLLCPLPPSKARKLTSRPKSWSVWCWWQKGSYSSMHPA